MMKLNWTNEQWEQAKQWLVEITGDKIIKDMGKGKYIVCADSGNIIYNHSLIILHPKIEWIDKGNFGRYNATTNKIIEEKINTITTKLDKVAKKVIVDSISCDYYDDYAFFIKSVSLSFKPALYTKKYQKLLEKAQEEKRKVDLIKKLSGIE